MVADIVVTNLPGSALGVLVLAAVAFGRGIGHLHKVCLAVSLVGSVISILHLVVNFNCILSQPVSLGLGSRSLTVHSGRNIPLEIVSVLDNRRVLLSRSDDSWQPVLAVGDMVAVLLDSRLVAGVALALVVRDGHPVVATAGNVVALSALFEVIRVVGHTEVNNITLFEVSGAQRSHAEIDDLSDKEGRALLEGSGSGSRGGGQEANGDGNLGEMHCSDEYLGKDQR